jgi:hypothetical protein
MLSKAAALRPVVPGRTSSASFKVIISLRPSVPPARWQDSWGFGVDLLTGSARKSPKISLRWPILSEPVDLDDLVRIS